MYTKRNNELDIVSLYCGNYLSRFYLRQISQMSKIPLKTCQNVLFNLEKEKILKSKIEGKNKYFELNLNNIFTKSYLTTAEIHKTDLFLEKNPEFKIFLKSICTNNLIIIFGSFAKNKADKNSDVDLLFVSEKEEKMPYHLLSNKVHEVILSEKSFKKAIINKETLLQEIQENHIIFNNSCSYINLLWEYYGKQKS